MLKIDTLRDALMAAIPELQQNPKLLRMWVDSGSAAQRETASRSFAFTFRLNVLLLDFASDIAALALPVLEWARIHQVDLLAPNTDAFTFEADFLDNGKADILIKLDGLKQAVAATKTASGYSLAYLPEPTPLFDDDLAPAGLTPVPALTAALVPGEGQVAPLPE